MKILLSNKSEIIKLGFIHKDVLSLEVKVKKILEQFEETPSKEILTTLNQIQIQFQSQITREYLKGKLKAISESSYEDEKKKLCKNLKPYLDWYLQGQ